MKVKKQKTQTVSKKRINSESPLATLLLVHSAEMSTHNDTIKLSFYSF